MKFVSRYSPNTWNWEGMDRDEVMDWATYASVSSRLVGRWGAFYDKPRILDLGCGAGRNTVFFARQGFNATGLDIDEVPLRLAGMMARAQNLNIEYTIGNMLNIPYPDNSFDCVYADNILSLTEYTGVQRAVSEIHRVLRPGGEAFMEFLSDSHPYKKVCRRMDSHTYIGRAQYGTHTVPISFIKKRDIADLLGDFDIIDDSGAIHGYVPQPEKFLILAAKRAVKLK